MANFLIDLFKKATKNNNYRTTDAPSKYNDSVAALNANNQNSPSTSKLNRLSTIGPSKISNPKTPGQ